MFQAHSTLTVDYCLGMVGIEAIDIRHLCTRLLEFVTASLYVVLHAHLIKFTGNSSEIALWLCVHSHVTLSEDCMLCLIIHEFVAALVCMLSRGNKFVVSCTAPACV